MGAGRALHEQSKDHLHVRFDEPGRERRYAETAQATAPVLRLYF
jgi:hypothetical protein